MGGVSERLTQIKRDPGWPFSDLYGDRTLSSSSVRVHYAPNILMFPGSITQSQWATNQAFVLGSYVGVTSLENWQWLCPTMKKAASGLL